KSVQSAKSPQISEICNWKKGLFHILFHSSCGKVLWKCCFHKGEKLMALLAFTANYEDLSTDRGYQFKFHCDKCGNGYMTRFQPSVTGMAGGFLRAAGDLFGGVFSSAGNSAYEIQRAVGGKAHDNAFAAAVEEAKGYFKQCTKCG